MKQNVELEEANIILIIRRNYLNNFNMHKTSTGTSKLAHEHIQSVHQLHLISIENK